MTTGHTDQMPRPSRVSVVIPCRNQAHFLAAALASVHAQHWPDLDLIVVDDGSTDGTCAIARQSGALVLRQPHAGVSAARNRGLAAATGTYLVFLDADDELESGAIASGVASLTEHPDAAMVARRCQLIDGVGRPLPTHFDPPRETDLYGEWLERNLVWTPGAALFRREHLLRVRGFPADVGPAADYAVYLQFARLGQVIVDASVAVRYRQHGSNMSRDPERMLRATLAVLARESRGAPEVRREAFDRGRRSWCTFYGEQIIQQLRMDVRAGTAGRAQLRAVWLLWRECRHLMFTHLARKLRRVAAGHPRADVEAGRFVPAEAPRGPSPVPRA